MPPSSSLQGLNIIHPAQDSSSVDARDLLLGQTYPDLSAQLDLWASLNFESDDPLAPENNERKNSLRLPVEEEEEEARSPVSEEKAIRDGHSNVVTPTNINNHHQVQNQINPGLINPADSAAADSATSTAQSFDLNALLASFGLDSLASALAAAPPQPQVQSHPQVIAPSLAQLLALHSVGYHPPGLPYPLPPNPSSATPAAAIPPPRNPPIEETYGSAKRPRRSSVTVDSLEDGSPSSASTPNSSAFPSPSLLTPLSAGEDKRRRNTAASARFRLKKKEREAALETKAKDLESKVVDLERECEALRRENGWLKGLVVGVTGAAAQTPNAQGLSTGTKRSRDEPGSV